MKHVKFILRADGLFVDENRKRRRLSSRAEVVAFGQYEGATDCMRRRESRPQERRRSAAAGGVKGCQW